MSQRSRGLELVHGSIREVGGVKRGQHHGILDRRQPDHAGADVGRIHSRHTESATSHGVAKADLVAGAQLLRQIVLLDGVVAALPVGDNPTVSTRDADGTQRSVAEEDWLCSQILPNVFSGDGCVINAGQRDSGCVECVGEVNTELLVIDHDVVSS